MQCQAPLDDFGPPSVYGDVIAPLALDRWLRPDCRLRHRPHQTKYMADLGAKVSSEAIRVSLRSEAAPFTGLMAQAADESAVTATDPGERRCALIGRSTSSRHCTERSSISGPS